MEIKQGTISILEVHMDAYPLWRYDDNTELYYPVFTLDEIPDEEYNFFVRAEFVSPTGIRFKGYLVSVTKYYCIAIFYCNNKYMFNKNLIKECIEDTQKIISLIDSPKVKKISDIFPLKYRTLINIPGFKELAGVFDAFERAKERGYPEWKYD